MSATEKIEPGYPLRALLELRARDLDGAQATLVGARRGLEEARGEGEGAREASRRAEAALDVWRREVDARRAEGFTVAEARAQESDERALRDRAGDARVALEAAGLILRAAEVKVDRAREAVEAALREHEVTSRHHARWRQQATLIALAQEEVEVEEFSAHKAARLQDER